ncbi:hypothetical protein Rleg4DRAFT_1869 [Rhizobium leguminosarum bv. trifolii WSM2297]|uniref:Uncharacterized protein n=1 Tax=Rhizobium leguminosarum bv. trifolii WSM2297 TaxID=754762 RepID=J0W525_RHILT|nr:hypothetical protein Rleg4DRAFT_1869 [Rhizobium leguminosarum bv. trifolii WSM2297]
MTHGALEQCQAEALEHHEDLLRDDPNRDAELAVYEVVLRVPDVAATILVLNGSASLLDKCLVSKKLVAVVAG